MGHFVGFCIKYQESTCGLCGLLSTECLMKRDIGLFFRMLLIAALERILRSSRARLGAGNLCAGMKKVFQGVEDFLLFCHESGRFLIVFHRR